MLTTIFGCGVFLSTLFFYASLNKYANDQKQRDVSSVKQYLNQINSFNSKHKLGLKHIANSSIYLIDSTNAPLTHMMERFLEDSKFKTLSILKVKENGNDFKVQVLKNEGDKKYFSRFSFEHLFSRYFKANEATLRPHSFFIDSTDSKRVALAIVVPDRGRRNTFYLGLIELRGIFEGIRIEKSIHVVVSTKLGRKFIVRARVGTEHISYELLDGKSLIKLHDLGVPNVSTDLEAIRFYSLDFEHVGWPWFILLGSLLITLILTIWLMGVLRRGVEVREMVKIRTRELELETERAERANSSKTRFLANMSHEIRTPLNIILGMAEILNESELNEIQRGNLKTISRSSYHLLSLIEDILEVNRIEASGDLKCEYEEFNLKKVVNEIVRFTAAPIRSKKVKFHYYMDPELPRLINGDARRLKQVILNLINNSLKFTDAGSIELEIRLGDEGEPSSQLKILVRDTGIGIKKEEQQRIFDSFVQVDPSSTRSKGGAGLGLSIVKTYVESMGGEIQVVSERNVGTKFTVTIPFTYSDDRRSWVEFFNLRDDLLGKKIFVMCESQLEFDNIAGPLKHFGAEVTHCKTGRELAGDIENIFSIYDYFVLDSTMSDLGALEILGLNKNRIKKKNRIVVMLHQRYRKGDIAALEILGIERVCFKPLIFNEFFKALKFNEKFLVSRPERSGEHVADVIPFSVPVLIAEDDPDNRMLIETFLKPMKLNLVFAVDGEDALQKFLEFEPQIVITDIQMPKMDGFGFLKEAKKYLHSMSLDEHCYFMVLTADAMPEQIQEAKRLGAEEYLTKPIRKHDFINKVIKAYETLMTRNP